MQWIRDDEPIVPIDDDAPVGTVRYGFDSSGGGLHLVALPGQRYVKAETGNYYLEMAVIGPVETPIERWLRVREPAKGVVHDWPLWPAPIDDPNLAGSAE